MNKKTKITYIVFLLIGVVLAYSAIHLFFFVPHPFGYGPFAPLYLLGGIILMLTGVYGLVSHKPYDRLPKSFKFLSSFSLAALIMWVLFLTILIVGLMLEFRNNKTGWWPGI